MIQCLVCPKLSGSRIRSVFAGLIRKYLVTGNSRVWKFADDMAGDRATEQPTGCFRALLRVCVKVRLVTSR